MMSLKCYRIHLQMFCFRNTKPFHIIAKQYKTYCMKKCQIYNYDEEVQWTGQHALLTFFLSISIFWLCPRKLYQDSMR